jgi:hypothetical protein
VHGALVKQNCGGSSGEGALRREAKTQRSRCARGAPLND